MTTETKFKQARRSEIGLRLFAERTKRDWSLREAAEHLGLSKTRYRAWEMGEYLPAPRFQVVVSKFVGLSLNELSLLFADEHRRRAA
jgi:transcriptional regulator with XRE-family HTH domain